MATGRVAFHFEMRWFVVFGCLAACGRPPAPGPAKVVTAPVVEVAAAPVDAGSAPAPTSSCSLTDARTIDDNHGTATAEGSMALHDVRILANDDGTVVTWTRTAQFNVGDTWRSPYAAVASGPMPFKLVDLPVEAYACATYGSVAPNTPAMPFVFWGVENTNAFEQFSALPAVKTDANGIHASYTTPTRQVVTPHQDVDVFVASHDVAFAKLTDMSCDSGCMCSDSWKEALWLRSLDPKRPFAAKVAGGKVDAPAFALDDKGGIAAWRNAGEIFWLRTSGDGKPTGVGVSFAKGDVGAPAVAMAGDDAIVVWASRPSKDSAYALSWMRIDSAGLASKPAPIATAGSAFAPAVIANPQEMVLAWMEGDGGRGGEIHVVRAPIAGPIPQSTVVSGDEPNARDPELSGTVENAAIVWSTFTKEKAAGILRVAHAQCSPPRR